MKPVERARTSANVMPARCRSDKQRLWRPADDGRTVARRALAAYGMIATFCRHAAILRVYPEQSASVAIRGFFPGAISSASVVMGTHVCLLAGRAVVSFPLSTRENAKVGMPQMTAAARLPHLRIHAAAAAAAAAARRPCIAEVGFGNYNGDGDHRG
ncbi:hypothetical protein THASP1DRAFT_21237 [Thamnocephalis sphaerospora]|uniref:Uncharacterized protein n=1 Tax=Thamnocephalis sphaerospora TaxID=78915 RepID=A0A4P9Y066_9FUNG|nr:hypothetical protein THASP1DRAFT_21237 [Thamnocephalis sphaerospora]|eukprot:RKP11140.1 hypothetical protein THASP1DRAFT_21237 [Thamnocephalis sphaerospora]